MAGLADGYNEVRHQQTNDNDSFLNIEHDFSQQDDSGPAVAPKLADSINKKCSDKLGDQKLWEKKEKYPRPTNWEWLVVPYVNPEI